MKPSFALLLSHDGLVLSHRASDGWLRIGEVALASPDVMGELAALRDTALSLAKEHKLGPLWTKLVLPNSEILYDTISVEGITSPDYDAVIRERLDGRTPYAMHELCYDYVVNHAEAQVAVVARETLAEAEAFAIEHGLDPICFAAVPPKGAFAGEAMFGTTQIAAEILAPSEKLERDMAPVVLVGDAIPGDSADPQAQPPAPKLSQPSPEPTPQEPDTNVAAPATPGPTDAGSTELAAKATPSAAKPGKTPPPKFASARTKAPSGARTTAPTVTSPNPPSEITKAAPDAKVAQPAKAPPGAAQLSDPAARRAVAAARSKGALVKDAPLDTPAISASKRAARPVGLILTVGLLAVLLLVGVVAAVLDSDDTAQAPTVAPPAASTADVTDPNRPAATELAARAPDPSEPEAETAAVGTAAVADVPSPEVIPQPVPSQPPVVAMTEGPQQGDSPATRTVSRFDAVPTPEEAAEGEEAAVENSPAPPEAPSQIALAPPGNLPVAADITDAETLAEAARPGLIETETRYAASGIWQRSPDPLRAPSPTNADDLYLATLDREITIEDALALPDYRDARDLRPVSPQPPIAPGQVFELDTDGQVTPTPDGALTPNGVLVFSEPDVRPSPRPRITPATTAEDLALNTLSGIRPPPRPQNVPELQERNQLDGRSRAELSAIAPPARPPSIQELAAAEAAPADADVVPPGAMAASPAPESRPRDFAQTVARIRAASATRAASGSETRSGAASASLAASGGTASAPTSQPTAPQETQRSSAPTIPTTASVARQATIENAMPLNRINLIGVYGTPNSRRALLRLASGRYVKVEVGDRVDGGKVAAIGETSLQYTRGGRNITLEMPRG